MERHPRTGATRPSRTASTQADARAPVSDRSTTIGARIVKPLALAIPLLVIAVYWAMAIAPSERPAPSAPLQRHAAATVRPGPGSMQTPAAPDDAEAMAARLVAHLEREPQDSNGWRTLARTWYVMERFPQAVSAYEKLAALGPIDADVLADYADATAMAQGAVLEGAPMELVRRALAQNPSQWKALSMAATDAFRRNDTRAAIAYWERALAAVPPDSPMADSIRESLAQVRR